MAKNTKSSLLFEKIKKQITNGVFGNSGERFLTVRELSDKFSVSLVTAQKIMKQLNYCGVITLYGKSYFITTGKISPKSQLQLRLDESLQNKFIGIHFPKFNNPFFSALLDEVSKCICKHGYHPLVMCSNQNPEQEKSILENFIKIGVCGVISCPNNNENESLKNQYENYPLPLVFLAEQCSSKGTHFAGVDNKACAKHVACHLIEMQYKNFIYIGAESDKNTDKRCDSFVNALSDNGYKIPKENIIYLSDNENFTIPYFVTQHIKSQEKPLGIFCFHDIIAVSVIMECEKLGIKIPEDVGVVGFDNLPIAKQCRPMLSSIAYRFDKMSETAVNLLVQKINCKSALEINTSDFINHSLKIRDSSRRKPL